MRVLMLAQFYPPVVGGEEQMVSRLSQALAARGHGISVATLWQEGAPDTDMDGGVAIHRLRSTARRAAWLYREPGRRHAPPFPDPELVLGLRQVIERERPHVVHAHNWLLHSFLPLKRWSRARLVVSLHDYSLACAMKRLMRHGQPCSGPGLLKCLGCSAGHYGPAKGIATALANRASGIFERSLVDRFLPVSQATAQGNGLTADGRPYEVIPNFVPDDLGREGEPAFDQLQHLPAPGYLLFVGDLSPDKGVGVLLEAYAGLEQAPPLVLIGRRVPQTPQRLPPGVLELGSWPHAAVMEAWRRCSLALAPSTWPEPFGIVAIEAMACGRPVIASRAGGLPDLVADGESGILVPPGEAEALRQAMARLLADPGLRERMGAAAARRARQFTASAVVPRVERVYRQVLAEAGAQARSAGRNGS